MNELDDRSESLHESSPSQEERLEQAIKRLAAGDGLDAILASSGDDAAWLEPMLSVAAEIRDLGKTLPTPSAKAHLAKFLAEAERMAPRSTPRSWPRPWGRRLADSLKIPSITPPRLLGNAVSVTLAVIILLAGSALFLGSNATAAAQNVLPGQPLYPIKRLGEEMYLRLPQSPQSRDARFIEYENRRLNEVRALLDQFTEARVSFRGIVETLDADRVVVSGIAAQITEETQIDGPIGLGARALVDAHTTADGHLIAGRILVERPGPPVTLPSPTATPQATATATPTREVTSTPQPTAAPPEEPTEAPSKADQLDPPARRPTEEIAETPEKGGDGDSDEKDGGENENNSDNSDDGNDNEDDGGGGNDNDDEKDNDNEDDGGGGNDNDDEKDNDNGDDSKDNRNEEEDRDDDES